MSELRRIFLVEDQRLVAAEIEGTLRRLGYEVAGSAPSGEVALTQVPALRPDLILMDIRLAGALDGIQTAAAIRRGFAVPIVYLTAHADDEMIARARTTAPFGYIVKPFHERELRAAIEIALYRHAADLELAEEQTRRKEAEEFRLLVESVEDYAIFRLDPEGRVDSWNFGAERFMGYRAEEVLGRHFSIFYPPEDRHHAPAVVLATAVREGRATVEGWRVRKDGSRFWDHSVVTALREDGGRLSGFAKVVRDMTERKLLEDGQAFLDGATLALASSLSVDETLQQAARLAVPSLADWCLIDLADGSGGLVQAAAAHVDGDRQELARRLARDLVPRPDPPRGAHHVYQTGEPTMFPDIGDAEWVAGVLGADHPQLLRELGVISYICVPIPGRERSRGVLSLLRAAPPRRYTAADLALAVEFVRRAALVLDNARLFHEAQEAVRARDEFLQIASHELKTPLTPLQIQLDTLGRALARAGVSDERLTDKLAVAIRQTARLNRLVENLLDVSRITGGRLELELEEFDLAEMVGDLVERFHGEAQKTRCALSVRAEGRFVGRWDRLRLEQVLSNLLSNAFKYGAGAPVEIDVQARGDRVRLAVADHGIGIEASALERIFDRFERAVSMRHFGGLGLGLFIARQIVEAHGGTIAAESQPGVGSTFTVQLPFQPPPAPDGAPGG